MVRRVRILFLLSTTVFVVLVAIPAGAEEHDPPPVKSSVTVLGPPEGGATGGGTGSSGGVRVSAKLSPVYWRHVEGSITNASIAVVASGIPCDPVTGIWMQHYVSGVVLPANYTWISRVSELIERSTRNVLGTKAECVAPPRPGAPAQSLPKDSPSYATLNGELVHEALATGNVMKASQPSFSPTRRALTGLEFRVWGSEAGPATADVTAEVDGWTSTAHVERLGYHVVIRDLTRDKVLLDTNVSSVGTASDPAVRYTFQRTGRISVTLTTRWNVTSSEISGNTAGYTVRTTVSPMGEIDLERTAVFNVIQVRSALVKNSK